MQCTGEEYLWNASGACFFRSLPIFCDGKNYSPPWRMISIGSIRKGSRNARSGAGHREPLRSVLQHLVHFFSLRPLRPASLPWSVDAVDRWEDTQVEEIAAFFFFFTGNSCRCYPVLFLPSQWKMRFADTKKGGDGGEHRVRLEHPAAMSLLDRRKQDGAHSARLLGKSGPCSFGVTHKDTWGSSFVSAEPAY